MSSTNFLNATLNSIADQYAMQYGKKPENTDELISYATYLFGGAIDNLDDMYDGDGKVGNHININRYFADGNNLLFQTGKNSKTFVYYDESTGKTIQTTDKSKIFEILDKMDGKQDGVLTDSKGNKVKKDDYVKNSKVQANLTKDGFELAGLDTINPPENKEVKYTEDEKKYLDSILNKNGKIDWSEHMAFMELADKNGDGVVTDAEKQAELKALKNDPSKVTELKNKIKSVCASYNELLGIDKKQGSNDDLKVSTEEFTKQFGADFAKIVDINGNGQISRLEYQAFVEMFDQDGDGKLLDKEVSAAKQNIAKTGTSSSSVNDQIKAIYNKLAKYNNKYVPMISGKLEQSTQPKNDEPSKLDKLLDNDGKYSVLEHQAFIQYADKNNDGIISDVEKEAAMKALEKDSEVVKLKAEYSKIKSIETELKSMDKNSDGKVSKEEFAAKYGKDLAEAVDLVLKTDGNIDIDEFLVLVKYADKNGDGKLDSDEIKNASDKLNNTDRDSKISARKALKDQYWKGITLRNQSYNYMLA